MSEIYDKYVAELEDFNNNLDNLDLSTTEGLEALISNQYNLYKNGNFLIINAFSETAKILYKSSGVKDVIDLALNMYLLGPTKILDLDYNDQKDFILNKANFLTYYALNVDSSYKKLALNTLNQYADMYTDGKHLYSKALLEKPSNPEDSLSTEMYKYYLFEYLSYGNELNDEELTLLGIDKNLLSLTTEELELKIKECKNDNQALKSIYCVLLNKGALKYSFNLAKLDNVFESKLYYYLLRRGEYIYSNDDIINSILDDDKPTSKNKIKAKKKSNKWFILTILLVLVKAFYLYMDVYRGSDDQIYAMGYDPSMANTLYYTTVAVTIVLLFLIFIKSSKALNIIFSILLLLITIYYIYTYPFATEIRDTAKLLNDLVIIGLIISIIKGFTNTSKL